jgi:MipA family protein
VLTCLHKPRVQISELRRCWVALVLFVATGWLLWVGVAPATAEPTQSAGSAALGEPCAVDCVEIGTWRFEVSLGYGFRTNPVIGQPNNQFFVVPKVQYYGKRFFIDNYDLGYTLTESEAHQVNAIILTPGFEQTFFEDYAFSDANESSPDHNNISIGFKDDKGIRLGTSEGQTEPQPFNLRKRRLAFFSGLEYSFISAYYDLQIQFLQDVTGVHDGQKIRGAVTLPLRYGKWRWDLSAGPIWQSAKKRDYFYGLTEAESATGEAFHPGAGTHWFVKSEWDYRLSEHWSLRALASYKWLDETIEQSPIVDAEAVTTLFVAGVYHF